jgi:hypothetical protein
VSLAAPLRLAQAAQGRALDAIGIERWVRRALTDSSANAATDTDPAASALIAFCCAPVEIGAVPLEGRYRVLLRQLIAALGLTPDVVSFRPLLGRPRICFGVAPGDAADALLAPPIAALAAGAGAKRSLWPQLRALRRRLGAG